MDTIRYYDENGDSFFDRTVGLDMTALYAPFLAHIPQGGHILDAGCGSGRDSRAFFERGYRVTAIDGSAAMVQRAAAHTGLPVAHQTFDQMDYDAAFEGIWACASLLHIPRADLPPLLPRFIRALKPGGVWYVSFVAGEGERTGERHFTDYDEASLSALVDAHTPLAVIAQGPPHDRRPQLQQQWLNALIRKG